MTKYRLILTLSAILLLYSCSQNVELNDTWLIEKMVVNDAEIYPNTVSESISITFRPTGYEQYEELRFEVLDSTVILPGFNSESYKMRFRVQGDTLKFYDVLSDQNIHAYYKQHLFDEPFKILSYKKEEYLELKSDSVYFMLFSERGLTRNRVNDIFK